MSDGFGGPKFRGDLSDLLPPRREETPDRWRDRLGHAWPIYVVLAVAVPVWVGAMAAAVVYAGNFAWFLVPLLLLLPVRLYKSVLVLRLFTNRDLDTGEKLGPRER